MFDTVSDVCHCGGPRFFWEICAVISQIQQRWSIDEWDASISHMLFKFRSAEALGVSLFL